MVSMTAPQRRALAALFVGAVCIGLAPIFVRITDVGPTAVAFWRTLLALPVLALLRARDRSVRKPLARGDRLELWLAGLCFAGDLAVWHQAIHFTSIANATLLANVAPVFVALALWLVWGEHQTLRFWLGLALALLGSGLLVIDSLSISRRDALGDALGVGAAAFYAGYQLAVSRLRQNCSTSQVMLVTSAVTAVALLPVVLIAGESLWPHGVQGWSVVIALALISHVVGQGLIAYALAELPPAFASAGLLVQPVAATGFAWLLLEEGFGYLQGLGGVVVLAGILLCRIATAKRPS